MAGSQSKAAVLPVVEQGGSERRSNQSPSNVHRLFLFFPFNRASYTPSPSNPLAVRANLKVGGPTCPFLLVARLRVRHLKLQECDLPANLLAVTAAPPATDEKGVCAIRIDSHHPTYSSPLRVPSFGSVV
jgi:hypothetical protein